MESINSNDKLNQDPDYFVPLENNKSQEGVCEKNALTTANKISKILETEFSKEIDAKKKEVIKIYETLNKACRIFHYLRFAIVSDYYNGKNTVIDDPQYSKQSRLHPTVNAPTTKINLTVDCENDCFRETNECNKPKRKLESEVNQPNGSNEPNQKKFKANVELPYMSNRKTKIRVVVGNYSKWIPHHCREDNDATHRWTVYVIDSQKSDLGNFVSKVRFFLHPSYQPNDVIELTSSPFHLSRLGWGEFPIRVQLHFKNNINKPVDIIHNLKLDRTYTGILTIGSETVVDIWLVVNDKIRPFVRDRNDLNDFISENTSNVPKPITKPIEEEKHKDVPLVVESSRDDILEQNENVEDNIIIPLIDHDYIKTNFAPTKRNVQVPESNNLKNNKKSLLKSNQENSNCAIIVDGGKIISSNQFHNFDELPVCANVQVKSENINGNFEKFYIDPKNYAPDKKHAKNLISLIEQAKPKNLFSVLTLITRQIPLITEKARDENYKLLFPYACESYEVFNSYLPGKKCALERCRALHALDIMRDIQCFESSCSAKEFIMWARKYGYTPLLNSKTLNKLSTASKAINVEEMSKNYDKSATISTELNDWLFKNQSIKPSIKEVDHDSDDEIDIINIESSSINKLSHHTDFETSKANVILLEYPEKYKSLNEFVCKTTENIGIKLTNEEIIPRVSHSSASLVISKALECLVDELTRSALSCAIGKHSVEKNIIDFEVKVDDVRKALLKREEFDIFTNAGLGSEG